MSNRLPKRSQRYGVGKEIGGSVYVHREYEGRLGDVVVQARKNIPKDFIYHVIKLNLRTRTVSFIHSGDFDTASEPTVGDVVTFHVDGTTLFRSKSRNPSIYHHKWLFVADDYRGFDVAVSRERSLAWLALGGVDRQRIGRRQYWDAVVVPHLNNDGETVPPSL